MLLYMWVWLQYIYTHAHTHINRYLSLLIPYLRRKLDWIQGYSYNVPLTRLLKYFLEQQRRKWSEQALGVDVASFIMAVSTHLSCLLRREKDENCWVVDLPRSPSALKFCHSVTALLRVFIVVKQCI